MTRGRKSKGPRLYLRKRAGREPTWVILDGGREQATDCQAHEVGEAGKALQDYIKNGGRRSVKPLANGEGYIYFVTADRDGYSVKIGFSRRPIAHRFRQLQLACPYPLKTLAVIRGMVADEKALHREFGATRLEGEWFERTDRLLERIRTLA